MIITSHAGHNPDGKIACGAVGLIKESTEARKVNNKLVSLLNSSGYTVYNFTVDNGTSQNDVLNKIVAKCNAVANVDLNISIHFNSGVSDTIGDGKTAGTEAWIYSANSSAKPYADAICNRISQLGFKKRGVEYSTGLAVLRNTKAPTVLVECCFVDDADDVKLYDSDMMATAIAQGVLDVAGGTLPAKEGWYQTGQKWRYRGTSGKDIAGEWIKYKDKFYYLDKDGWMKTGWIQLDDRWYFLNPDGSMVANNWTLQKNKWYYLNPSGSMATGWVQWKGLWYYLNPNGDMAVDTITPDGYKVDADGVWVQ